MLRYIFENQKRNVKKSIRKALFYREKFWREILVVVTRQLSKKVRKEKEEQFGGVGEENNHRNHKSVIFEK